MKIEVKSIQDNADGSCNIEWDMDSEALEIFAAIGLTHVLKESALETITNNPQGHRASRLRTLKGEKPPKKKTTTKGKKTNGRTRNAARAA